MKSQANGLLRVALALLKDVQVSYPSIHGLGRDQSRLTLGCQERGLGFFTLDLPELDSMLTQGLETGRLSLKGPFTKTVSKRIRVPRFLSGLWLRVFDKDACLRKDADVNSIAFLRQIFCLGKRVQTMCSDDRLQKALQEYHDVERHVRPPSLSWDGDRLESTNIIRSLHFNDALCSDVDPLLPYPTGYGSNGDRLLLARCQRVADILSESFGDFDATSYSWDVETNDRGIGFKHGPGAIASPSGIGRTKYDFRYWSAKLEEHFPYRMCGTHISDVETSTRNHEVPARLIAVPKTAKSPRLIAAEPVEHQWCQQIIRHFLVERLRKNFGTSFVAFHRQDLSGEMALRGSLDGSLATIDLSSASDRISCWAVERLFRRNTSLLRALHSCRTRWVRDDISRTPSFFRLKKFASQGTAVTFPVQSILFLVVALAANADRCIKMEDLKRLRSRVRVFGDDIIVPKEGYENTVRLLTLLGLKVNENKSFSNGLFRESCGTDAYGGYDVTPAKPRIIVSDGPASRQAILDTSNNLFCKGYWHASESLLSTLPKRVTNLLRVVGRESGLSGVISFNAPHIELCGRPTEGMSARRDSYYGIRLASIQSVAAGYSRSLKYRFNERTQVLELRTFGFRSKSPRLYTGERAALLQYFTEDPRCQPGWQHGLQSRPKLSDGPRWEPAW